MHSDNHIHGTCWWAYEMTSASLSFFLYKQLPSGRDMSALFDRISAWDIIRLLFTYFTPLMKLIRSINFAFIIYIHFFFIRRYFFLLQLIYTRIQYGNINISRFLSYENNDEAEYFQ